MKKQEPKKRPKTVFGKIWYFIWEDNSIWSWIVNIILAYLLIKFLVYPGLGFALSTSHPFVSVMSGSMEHKIAYNENAGRLELCGDVYAEKNPVDFDYYWQICGEWYEAQGINKEAFVKFPLKNGFNKGDMIILRGVKPENLKIGEVIVFKTLLPEPIIHRIVKKELTENGYVFQTKGDHNGKQWVEPALEFDETKVTSDKIIGKTVIRLPVLGYVKIWFTNLVNVFR